MRKQQTERSLKPHGQYNTRCAIPLLHNAICREIWRSKGKQEVQQEPVIHLLPERNRQRKRRIASVPVETAAQPSPGAHQQELKLIRDMHCRNPKLGIVELWARGYTRCVESLWRVMRREGLIAAKKKAKKSGRSRMNRWSGQGSAYRST